MVATDTIVQIRQDAQLADELHERSRRLLVASARAGVAAGLSQRQIADAIGRSQPEVSRLVRFHGTTALGRILELKRTSVLKLLSASGAHNVRVFGSVSRGEDGSESDIDLLADFAKPVSLFTLSRLESAAAEILGAPVDVVPAGSLRESLADRVLSEAIPL